MELPRIPRFVIPNVLLMPPNALPVALFAEPNALRSLDKPIGANPRGCVENGTNRALYECILRRTVQITVLPLLRQLMVAARPMGTAFFQ